MTYNVFSGTLKHAQSINPTVELRRLLWLCTQWPSN